MIFNIIFRYCPLLAILALVTPQGHCADVRFENHQALQAAAVAHAESLVAGSQKHVIEMRQISSRLKLKKCLPGVIFFMPHDRSISPGKNTLGAKCEGQTPWTIYLSFELKIFDRLVVATRNLARGEVLDSSMLAVAETEVPGGRYQVFRDRQELLGMQVTKRIDLNEIIDASMVERPMVIKKGQKVNITYMDDQFNISMSGIAQQDGAINQKIRVKNETTDITVEGIVKNRFTVEIR